ncbi:MAG TPA: polyprenyl synthetase family protein [Syntrophomonadaceae bacterium]|nr:polyprenyl synthetase family protein [Syntrophomonadaceae bacterium]
MSNDSAVKLHFFPEEMVVNRLQDILHSEHEEIDRVIGSLMESRGKLLRPRLVYLCASLQDSDPLMLRDAAVAVELIHLASLVHDDVIDHSPLRRGKESLNARWGEKISVLAGDYLFASAFHLISRLECREIMECLAGAIKIMCSGEIKQLIQAHSLVVSQEEYFEKTFAKTACLFASACRVGSLTSNLPGEQGKILEQYGLCLGYAYQIIDDVLDFAADSKELGKPVGGDLLEGNITLPVLLALEDPEHSQRMCNLLRDGTPRVEDLPRILQVLEDSCALEKSLRWASGFLNQSMEVLNHLPDNSARRALKELALFLGDGYYRQMDSQRACNLEA